MRDAATVIVVRDAPAGIEVYLLRRVPGMAFAPGMWVFPGGSVDPGDARTEVPDLEGWPLRLHAGRPLSAALISAAIRETFEESGVLVATSTTADPSWEIDRRALIDHERTLADVLRRHDAVIRTEALRAWSHWVTPEGEPRRYDTRFFLTALPDGQNPHDVGGEACSEASEAMWMRPDRTDELPMLPPTRVTLAELAEYDSVAALLAADRRPEPILPVRRGSGVELPDGTVM